MTKPAWSVFKSPCGFSVCAATLNKDGALVAWSAGDTCQQAVRNEACGEHNDTSGMGNLLHGSVLPL